MTRISLAALVVVVAGLVVPAGAQKPDQAAVMLEAANQKVTLEGDLHGAIRQYEAIVSAYAKSNRGAAAQALLRMAECYQRLGDPEARKVYERLVKDYADQTEEVTVARARLGAAHLAAGNGGRVSKQRWTGPKVNNLGTVSLDGRFVPFVDPETGDLALHELATGTDRRLTTRGVDQAWVDFAQDTAISRDGAHIAYSWYVGTKGRYELRVATVNSGAESTPRIVLDNPDIGYMTPHDWSPDGRWIAVHVKRKDGTAQIGLVDAADGSLRVLKSVDWRGSIKMSVSPDGRFIAYDLPVGDARGQRDVFVLSVDGSREVPAYAHAGYDAVVGWSPDGRSLLVSSDRSGPMALWLLPMTDGRPAGPATLIEPDLGPFVQSLGLTRSGSLVFVKKIGAVNVHIATVDFATGALLSPAESITDSYLWDHGQPVWSQDGGSLAYSSSLASRKQETLSIHSLEGGRTREVTPRLVALAFPRRSPDDALTYQGADLKGRQGIYRVDVETGDASLIVTGDGYLAFPSWTPDGRFLVYLRNRGATGGMTLEVRDQASGQERVLARTDTGFTFATVSPDGRLVAYRTGDKPGDKQSTAVLVVPLAGGASREILRVTKPTSLLHLVDWLPDGRRLLVGKVEGGKHTAMVIPLDGGAPVELALPQDSVGPTLRVHPDGRRVAYTTGDSSFEVWTLENFLPVQAAKR